MPFSNKIVINFWKNRLRTFSVNKNLSIGITNNDSYPSQDLSKSIALSNPAGRSLKKILHAEL
jgi:hypothetical protein